MRAWEFRGNQDIARVDRPVPEPAEDEVRVKIAFAGICGTDLHEFYAGPVVTITATDATTGATPPVIPGHEASGVVDAVGVGVSGVHVGDRVVIEPIYGIPPGGTHYNVNASFYGFHADGFLADYAVVKETSVHQLPESISLRDGALVEPLSVAVHTVSRISPSTTARIVIFGAGPVGVGLSFVLAARGIRDVVVAEPSPVRRAALQSLGFDVVDTAEFEVRVADGTVDVVFDAAGVPAVLDAGMRVLSPGGTYVLVATYPEPIVLDAMAMLGAELSVVAVNAYDRGDFEETIGLFARGAIPTSGWVESVPFERAVDTGYPSLRAAEAAKVLVEIGGEA